LRGEPIKPKIDEGARFRDIILEKAPNKDVLKDIQKKKIGEAQKETNNSN
jgi:hypothetical protein